MARRKSRNVDQDKDTQYALIRIPDQALPKKGIIPAILKYFGRFTESPETFIVAAALMLLASIAKDAVVIKEGPMKYKLICYFLIIGPSTAARKSSALRKVCVDMLEWLEEQGHGPYLFPEKATLEALLAKMSGTLKDSAGYLVPGQRTGTLVYSEYTSFLANISKKYNQDLKPFFVDQFDGKSKITVITTSRGEQTVHNPLINIIAAATLEGLKESLQDSDLYTGFLARHLMFYAEPSDRCIPFFTDGDHKLLASIKQQVLSFAEMVKEKGKIEMLYSGEAQEYYEEWYKKDREREWSDDSKTASSSSRDQLYIKKIAALFQLSEDGSSTISGENMKRAILLIEALRRQRRIAIDAVFTSEELKLQRTFCNLVAKEPGITRSGITHKLQSKGWGAQTINAAERELVNSNMIRREVDNNTGGRSATRYFPIAEETGQAG